MGSTPTGWATPSQAPSRFALLSAVLSGFVRVVTNARIFAEPATTLSALEFIHALIDAPSTTWLPPAPSTWAAFRRLAQTDAGIHGNHIADAYLASVAVAHGARLATADRGFARYRGLTWFDPVSR